MIESRAGPDIEPAWIISLVLADVTVSQDELEYLRSASREDIDCLSCTEKHFKTASGPAFFATNFFGRKLPPQFPVQKYHVVLS